jgi:hypothetical protein
MMSTFMKGIFIVGLAAFNWAYAAPVTAPSSLSSLAPASANTLVSSPALSQIKVSTSPLYDQELPALENLAMYSDANMEPIQTVKILDYFKTSSSTYGYFSNQLDSGPLMHTWEIAHDRVQDDFAQSSFILQKREIALLEALCKATKGCVLPQP